LESHVLEQHTTKLHSLQKRKYTQAGTIINIFKAQAHQKFRPTSFRAACY